MKTSLTDLLRQIPGAPTPEWPGGDRYAEGLNHGTMSFGVYAPIAQDPQTPHPQDELYVIQSGSGDLVIADVRHRFKTGDVYFVAAEAKHRFENFTADFCAWVVFWGPPGGERDAAKS